jgi:hypothetical protein
MTWIKDDNMWVYCEPIDSPDSSIKLGPIPERIGTGILNGRHILTPVQRLYIGLLKYGRHVLSCAREGNRVYVSTIEYSDRPETQLISYTLEPKDAVE